MLKAAEIKGNIDTEIKFGYMCCINFLSQVIFVFLLFLGMVMYAKLRKFKKKKKNYLRKKQHHVLFSYSYTLPLSFLFFILFFLCFTEKDNAQSYNGKTTKMVEK